MFSSGVERAIAVAIEAHAGQLRRGRGSVPYVVHPLHIAIMLARWGMDEDLVTAGLLHDVVEDSDAWTLERIEAEFGAHLATIVGELTEDKSKSWEERKQSGIDKVARLSSQAATVKAVDKLHNLSSLLAELQGAEDPADVWGRFRGGRDGTLRVAREMVAALAARVDPRLARELERVLAAVTDEDAAATAAGV